MLLLIEQRYTESFNKLNSSTICVQITSLEVIPEVTAWHVLEAHRVNVFGISPVDNLGLPALLARKLYLAQNI
jgi:hypothetical protein